MLFKLFGRGHIEDVYDISWTRDGNFMVSGSVDNTAIMWDVTKGKMCVHKVGLNVSVELYLCCLLCLLSVNACCSLVTKQLLPVLYFSGQKLCIFNDHKSYVQGVTWDPLGQYVATLSCDR